MALPEIIPEKVTNFVTDTVFVPIPARSMRARLLRCKVRKTCQLATVDELAKCADTVLLQAMKEDPPPDARCRDKFLVQTAALAPDSDASNIPAIVGLATRLLVP